jgi:hypothetical protein
MLATPVSVQAESRSPMSVVRPKTDQLTKVQLGLNFGLVGVSCTVSQACVHWVQTTMVRQQLAAMKGDVLNFPSQFAAISRTEVSCAQTHALRWSV